jgi:Integrase zinc binding domain
MWKTQDSQKLAIPPDPDLFQEIMRTWHDPLTAGHPGRDETIRRVTNQYHWPGARQWIESYIKGCVTCQQNKNLTHRMRTPLYHITVPPKAQPFEQITMDLITGLPKSEGYDAILTIVDHGCSRGALFLPCHTTITGPQIAHLYLNNVYRWFGLPKRIISDRDPRFTSHFGKALGKELGINWNLSSTVHPQTDRLSE